MASLLALAWLRLGLFFAAQFYSFAHDAAGKCSNRSSFNVLRVFDTGALSYTN
jgi:hypothetical protein